MTGSSTFIAADGDGYELQMGRWSRRLAPLFIDFTGVTAGGNVLDVGCGTGSLTFALAQNDEIRGIRGLDFSSVYVAYARRRSTDPRIEFQTGDACALPFPDASFDHALSMLVLQFIPQPERAVREMRRVTRPGGTVAAATWDMRGGLVCYRLFLDTAAMLDPAANARRARICTRGMTLPGQLEQAWHAAGLRDVVGGTLTIRMEFGSFADFWTPLEGKDGTMAEYVATLESGTKARLREMVELAYLDGEADGPRSYAASAWVVKGTVPA